MVRLRNAEGHVYAFSLRSGEALRLAVDQQGIDLVAEVFDPGGRPVLKVDGPTSDRGLELVCFVAHVPGRHLIRLHPLRIGEEGDYRIRLTRRGPMSLRDRQCSSAVQALERAQKRRQENARLSEVNFAAYRQAGDLFQAAGETFHEAIARKEGCGVLLGLGELARAADCYGTALRLARAAGSGDQEAAILNLLGLTLQQQGELSEARARFDQALAVSKGHGMLAGEASALNNLASLDRQQGQHHQAIGRLEAALEIWRALGKCDKEAASLHNLGSVYAELGHFDEALELLGDALAIRRAGGRPDLAAGTLIEIGWAHHLAGRSGAGAECFREAVRLYQLSGQPLGEAAALDRLGSALRQEGEVGGALAAYRRALGLAQQAGDALSVAHTRANLGWLRVDQGQPERARDEFAPALETFLRLGEPDGRAHVLVGLAAAAEQQGDLETARLRLEEALKLIEEVRASGRRRGYWIQSISLWRDYYERYVELLLEMHRRGHAPDTLSRAFEFGDWAKGRSLYDMLLESQVNLRSGADTRLRAEEAAVQARLNATEERRVPADTADRIALERSLRDSLQEYRRIEAAIREADPRLADISHPRRIRLAEVQRLLDRQTRLISFVLGERRSFLFVVGPSSIEYRELPVRGPIEAAAQTVYQGLVNSNQLRARRQVRLAAEALSQTLLGSVRLPPEVRRLLIVAEGGLLYIPFAALPLPGSREQELLIDRYEVIHLPSAATLVALRQRKERRPTPPRTLAILADPVFSPDDPRLPRGRAARLPARFLPLPFTRLEAESILARVPESERLIAVGFEASRDLVLSGALADYRILHFATHAVIDELHPELSGLVLSGFDRNGRARQAQLRLHEIYGLDLPADLVVLSACRTALGRRIRGDGVVGLTQGFLYAGSSRLIVSLWDVDDSATAALMAEFYRQLFTAGLAPAAALREAQLSIRRQPRWQAPRYWAGFVVEGDGFPPVELR